MKFITLCRIPAMPLFSLRLVLGFTSLQVKSLKSLSIKWQALFIGTSSNFAVRNEWAI